MTQAVPSPAKCGSFCLFPFTTGRRFPMFPPKTFFPLFPLLILATLLGYPVLAASDDYLKAIEAEGDRLEFLGQAKKEHEMLMRVAPQAKVSQKPTAAQKKTAKAAPATDAATRTSSERAEFELALRKSFPGSFALYSLLEPQEKEAVFNEYERSNSEGTIRFLPAVTKIISFNSTANKPR